MSKKQMRRVIWCDTCHHDIGGSPQMHLITYHGTEYVQGRIKAKFDAQCLRCQARDPDGEHITQHVVGIASYNALVSREIYDSNTAP